MRERDVITVLDEYKQEKQLSVEALIVINSETFALLTMKEDISVILVMQVKNERDGQYLFGIDDPAMTSMVLDAYEIAVDANPAD
ncbi:hypothetical protein [Bacillus sp. J37]|uniref:hypothetical protein n=1 Tax=Bacillus sp. J37 TaxID=935837 RepID=UPI0004BC5DA6|nr:hypothetical protein [Bacillus sp. J37]